MPAGLNQSCKAGSAGRHYTTLKTCKLRPNVSKPANNLRYSPVSCGGNLFYNSPMEACVIICRTAKPNPGLLSTTRTFDGGCGCAVTSAVWHRCHSLLAQRSHGVIVNSYFSSFFGAGRSQDRPVFFAQVSCINAAWQKMRASRRV